MLSKYLINKLCSYLNHIKFRNGIYCLQLGKFVGKKIDNPLLDIDYIIGNKEDKNIIKFLSEIHPTPHYILKMITSMIFSHNDRSKPDDGKYFYWYGLGSNGKTTLWNIVNEIFGPFTCIYYGDDEIYDITPFWCKMDSVFMLEMKTNYLSNILRIVNDFHILDEGGQSIIFPYKLSGELPKICKGSFARLICQYYTASLKNEIK